VKRTAIQKDGLTADGEHVHRTGHRSGGALKLKLHVVVAGMKRLENGSV
jgi:hypothetical protein